MGHDENNSAMQRICAVEALTKAEKYLKAATGALSPVDDKHLFQAIEHTRCVLAANKIDTPKREPLVGDVRF